MYPQNHTLLVVDDNMNNIQILASMLTNFGFNVEFATNGVDALQWVTEENFDLILLDVMMPQMDGFEVCEKIRLNTKFKELPIIFLTAKTDKESIVKGFSKGGNDYITKPFDQKELLARVTTQLELKTSRDKLAEINIWLEKKVNERTKELNNALIKVTDLNKKLLILDEVKSDFLKMISHEIRTPLNGIVGFTDIIKSTNESNHLNEFIDLLVQSVSRLEKVSLNALLLTSLKLENYYVDNKTVNLNLIVKKCLIKLENKLTQNSINININCPENQSMLADVELISNAISIILDNAIRYTPNNGEIDIYSELISENIVLTIKDYGPGFNKKALGNLFTFFGSGEKHFDQNIGIGLALANQILLAHNGKIEIKNINPQGAAVKLFIPSSKAD